MSTRSGITVDEDGVRRLLADGTEESVTWSELSEVAIRTTPEGPWKEDVFFLLVRAGGGGCAVPAGDPSADDLMSRLQSMPGFDDEVFIEAMTTQEDGLFVVWQRNRQEQPIARSGGEIPGPPYDGNS